MIRKHRLDPVFLLSPGRSGSTLLQRFLNSSAAIILWGEHAGFVSGWANSYRQFMKNEEVTNLYRAGQEHVQLVLSSSVPVGVDIEWTNNFTREDFHNAHVQLFLDLFAKGIPSTIRWGFKEIRYAGNEVSFLRELFPQAQFVYIVRDPIDTIVSMVAAWFERVEDWRSNAGRRDKAIIKDVERFLKKSCKRMEPIIYQIKDDCLINKVGYLVKYEELSRDPVEIVRDLCAWLSIPFPEKEVILAIADDKRMFTDSTDLEDALQRFYHHDFFQELLDIYRPFGY